MSCERLEGAILLNLAVETGSLGVTALDPLSVVPAAAGTTGAWSIVKTLTAWWPVVARGAEGPGTPS